MKSLYLGASMLAVAAAAIVPASAADMYRGEGSYKDGSVYAPVATWTGFYAGINGGYGWPADSFESFSPAGGFGGGQIGYNLQGAFGHPHLLLGVEADIQSAGISDSGTFIGEGTDDIKASLNWFGTVRGRIGYAFDRTLIYATGGFAVGEVESKIRIREIDSSSSTSERQTGYVLGGGIEYKLSPSWSLKGEYQFLSLDASDLVKTGNGAGPLGLTGDRTEVHTARVGLNYHVGQGYEPLK